jgi:16S rRNA (cytosine1402-N4)-methyltransferase
MNDHQSVLLHEALDGLAIKPNGIYLDLTLGRGGHTQAILQKLKEGNVIAFDQDDTAIQSCTPLTSHYPNLKLIHKNFSEVTDVLRSMNMSRVDGILMDLGVSSPQFDVAERGFSYRLDSALDMRMDRRQTLTAYALVNQADISTLTAIFRDYADETFAYPIAKAIIKQREKSPIKTTYELVALIKEVKPDKVLKKKGHPAKQVFQALRIAVNDEFGRLKSTIEQSLKLLNLNGRLVVITFHSGEDKIVKDMFREATENIGTRHGPESMIMHASKPFKLVHKKVIVPAEEEIRSNHRSESAKMRIIERIKL